MTRTRQGEPARDPVEEILHGLGLSSDPDDRLVAILRAASAPPGPGPLAGEHEIMMAFRAAKLDTRPRRRRRSIIAGFLSAKVALATAGLALVGGVALAASTGTIPNPLRDQGPDRQPSPAGKPSPSPSVALIGLCIAHLNGASPAPQALVLAAGGEHNIDDYCAGLLDSVPGAGLPPGSAGADPTDRPGNRPSGLPTPSHPTKPTARPSRPTVTTPTPAGGYQNPPTPPNRRD